MNGSAALWPGKLVVKGLLHSDDAWRAMDAGADAHHRIEPWCGETRLHASHHRCVAAVSPRRSTDRIPVFFDGGIRSGTHVLVALCLGARFCFVGRAPSMA